MTVRTSFAAMILVLACAAGAPGPAQPDPSTTCAGCRMMVSDLRFAAQLVAPGEEPRFFDDIGCMRRYLDRHREQADWSAFVSDYRTRGWIALDRATVWNCPSLETPMSSHLAAVPADAEKPAQDCTRP